MKDKIFFFKKVTHLYFIPNVSIRYAITKAALKEEANKNIEYLSLFRKLELLCVMENSKLTFLISLHYHEPVPFLKRQTKDH